MKTTQHSFRWNRALLCGVAVVVLTLIRAGAEPVGSEGLRTNLISTVPGSSLKLGKRATRLDGGHFHCRGFVPDLIRMDHPLHMISPWAPARRDSFGVTFPRDRDSNRPRGLDLLTVTF